MTFLLSLGLMSLVLFVFAIQVRLYNQLEKDRFRFAYFALRDRLALLVTKGQVEEDSWEYSKLVDVINFHINAVDTLSIMRIARILTHYHTSSKEDRQVRILQKKTDNEEVKVLVIDFLQITQALLTRNSRAQIATFNFLKNHRIKTPRTSLNLNVAKPKMALERIERNVSDLTHSLHACA